MNSLVSSGSAIRLLFGRLTGVRARASDCTRLRRTEREVTIGVALGMKDVSFFVLVIFGPGSVILDLVPVRLVKLLGRVKPGVKELRDDSEPKEARVGGIGEISRRSLIIPRLTVTGES